MTWTDKDTQGTIRTLRIAVVPREASNPYQELLYAELRQRNVKVSYLGALTPSGTVNLALMPMELIVRRLIGTRLVHFHWSYSFRFLGTQRFPILRRVSQAWFLLFLWIIRVTGMRLVWTAHNVLPHHPVLADDRYARLRLVAACDLVIAHSSATLEKLAELDIKPRNSIVIPHGRYLPNPSTEALRVPGSAPGPRRLLFFGKVEEYKGVQNLIVAFGALSEAANAHLMIAGECNDKTLISALKALAHSLPDRVTLRLSRVPEEQVSTVLEWADVVLLPYRHITTSGSGVLALSHGRPLVIPDLPGLADLPEAAVLRYDGTTEGLKHALQEVLSVSASTLGDMSAAAYKYSATLSWSEIGDRTLGEMAKLFQRLRTAAKVVTYSS